MTKETNSEIKPLFVTAKQIKQMLCIGDSSIRTLVYTRDFPRPLDLGICRKLWRLSDVEEWVRKCKPHPHWS